MADLNKLKELTPEELDKIIEIATTLRGTPTTYSANHNIKKTGNNKKTENIAPIRRGGNTKTQGRGRTQSVPQPFEIKQRPNNFTSSSDFRAHKDDTKIDKKLCNAPVPKNIRKSELVEVFCMVCGDGELISVGLVPREPERYKCNNCFRS